MSITVYGLSGSPFVRKVAIVLNEKNINYDFEQVMVFNAPDWFLEMSPLKRIPVLKETTEAGEVDIPDSSAICAYLEKRTPSPALYPQDVMEYGRAMWLEEYADTGLAQEVGMGIFRPLIVNPMLGKELDPATAEKSMAEKMPPLFDYLEGQIGEGEFLVGTDFSIADISLIVQMINLRHTGNTPDPARWPILDAYIKRISARPSVKKELDAEAAMFPNTIILDGVEG